MKSKQMAELVLQVAELNKATIFNPLEPRIIGWKQDAITDPLHFWADRLR